MKGVAFKVAYHDTGGDKSLFGYDGICSPENMLVNVRTRKMRHCSDSNNPCRQYVDSNFKGHAPRGEPCYESTMFSRRPIVFGGGYYHGDSAERGPIPIKNVDAGDIAFLTTLLPKKRQHERIVFGCFRVAKKPRLKRDWGYIVESDGTMDVGRIPDRVADQLNFWRYYQNKGGSKLWGTGLFRYLDEQQTELLLNDIVGLLGDHTERDVILKALGKDFQPRPIRRLPIVGAEVFGGGGYAGGESEAHLKIKNFVARHPEAVGLPKSAKSTIEFAYVAGDQVDVKFDLPDGSAAVVEVETISPFPGAHQCIKYRALLEAEMGLPLGSGKVQAILVANVFDAQTKEFAKRYGIKLVRLDLG